MSIPWLILAAVVVSGVVLLVLQKRQATEVRRRLDEQLAEERERATRALTESQARVKRIERQSNQDIERAEHRLLEDLLPLLDALESAGHSAEQGHDVRKGLELVTKQLDQLLEKHGVERIHPAEGSRFDPSKHEAVEVRETDNLAPGLVVGCHRTGFSQGDDVLRAAMVAVSKQASESTKDDESEGEVELDLSVGEQDEDESETSFEREVELDLSIGEQDEDESETNLAERLTES